MQTSNLFWLGLFYFKIFKMTTTPSAGGQIWPIQKLECLMLQKDALKYYPSISNY